MQTALRFLTRHAEIFSAITFAYMFSTLFFTETMSELGAVIWPALIVGLGLAFLIALKNEAEMQKTAV